MTLKVTNVICEQPLTGLAENILETKFRESPSIGLDKLCFFSHLLFYSPILRIYAYYAFKVVLLFSMLVSILSTLQRLAEGQMQTTSGLCNTSGCGL